MQQYFTRVSKYSYFSEFWPYEHGSTVKILELNVCTHMHPMYKRYYQYYCLYTCIPGYSTKFKETGTIFQLQNDVHKMNSTSSIGWDKYWVHSELASLVLRLNLETQWRKQFPISIPDHNLHNMHEKILMWHALPS